jgi:hypothetical protein
VQFVTDNRFVRRSKGGRRAPRLSITTCVTHSVTHRSLHELAERHVLVLDALRTRYGKASITGSMKTWTSRTDFRAADLSNFA